jgi:curli biogenesis system outer membrane secretion channel CsgG
MRQPTNRTLALVAIVGWVLAVIGIGGLFFTLWNQSRFSSYSKRLEEVSAELVTQIRQAKQDDLTIAALPFSDFSGRESQLGLFLADHLSTELRRQGQGIQLVDRLNLPKVLEEQKLSTTSLTDPTTGVRLGRLSTADTLMVGRIDLSSNSIILDVSLVDVETSRRLASSATTIIATDQMQRLWIQPIPGTHATEGKEVGAAREPAAAVSENSAFGTLVKDFLVTNWPWIWTVLFVPILTWFVARRRQKGPSEDSPRQVTDGEEAA